MSFMPIIIIPTIITIVIIEGIREKKDVYNLFCEGTIDGIKTVKTMFPTMIAVFLSISMLRNSGVIEFLVEKINYFTKLVNIPNEIIPLMIIKPISGSASLALATDLMKEFGAESRIGQLAATIMSSSETTFYVIAMYVSSIKIKNGGKVIIPALMADLAMMITAIMIIK